MDAKRDRPRAKGWLRFLVGIEAGVIGGLLMLIFLAVGARLIGQPWWYQIHLLGSNVYSASYLFSGVGAHTAYCIAWLLMVTGLAGGIAGWLHPGGRLYGLGVALLWFVACEWALWRRWAPLVQSVGSLPLYGIGFFLFGSALGWHPRLLGFVLGDAAPLAAENLATPAVFAPPAPAELTATPDVVPSTADTSTTTVLTETPAPHGDIPDQAGGAVDAPALPAGNGDAQSQPPPAAQAPAAAGLATPLPPPAN